MVPAEYVSSAMASAIELQELPDILLNRIALAVDSQDRCACLIMVALEEAPSGPCTSFLFHASGVRASIYNCYPHEHRFIIRIYNQYSYFYFYFE